MEIRHRQAAEDLLRQLKRERDRQVIARRFGFGLNRRHTLEAIGRDFGITRERVRQIEKAGMAKLKRESTAAVTKINLALIDQLSKTGYFAPVSELAEAWGVDDPKEHSYFIFLGHIAPDIEVLEANDDWHDSLAIRAHYSATTLNTLRQELEQSVASLDRPATLAEIKEAMPSRPGSGTVRQLAKTSRRVVNAGPHWGLSSWPQINPRSIRDKTYLVLKQSTQPLHFREIAKRVQTAGAAPRPVTTQAVHNELIKDGRFVLIGRGIYALAEWGYAPGTVADIIMTILQQESPLHRDEIIRRVLDRRQVKPTTIVLNLQEKDQFMRVARATYKLRVK